MPELVVTKFGGSSLADASQFAKVKEIIDANPDRRYVIPSAPGKRFSGDHKITDLLYMCRQLAEHNIDSGEVFNVIVERVEEIHEQLGLQEKITPALQTIYQQISAGSSEEFVASRGEYISGLLLSEYLGIPFIDAAEVMIFTDDGLLDSQATEAALQERLSDVPRAVIPGFYGASASGDIHTFSRGGSDVTGAVIASAVNADLYENWTDVSGFLKADPRVVKNASPIERVTYRELRELAYMGAPVLHEEAIFPVREKGIPIHILNTNNPDDSGTLIIDDRVAEGFSGVTGLAGKRNFSVISIEKTLMNDERGFFRKVVSVFETNGVSIAHMPSGIDSVSVVVATEAVRFKLNKIIEELRIYCRPDEINVEDGIALLAVVGLGMIRTPGIAGRVFGSLAKAGVNVRMITQGSSELSIIIGITNDEFDDAVRAVYSGT